MKFFFCRIGWMDLYKGLKNDKPRGGGGFVDKYGKGYEVYNFKPYKNKVYGYVETLGLKLDINRLGANNNDLFVRDINIIWFSKNPDTGGQFIVGWYKNAIVYRHLKDDLPMKSGRIVQGLNQGKVIEYYFTTSKNDAVLLPPDERTFRMPPKAPGWPGHKNIWYCDKKTQEHIQFIKDIEFYIKYRKLPKSRISRIKYPRRGLQDYKKKKEIELKAMEIIERYYHSLGYVVKDVSKANLGYDLEVYNDKNLLYLEVKGLSSNNILAELTPNEFQTMNNYKDNYRACIITDVLAKKPNMYIFRYSYIKGCWIDQIGNKLIIKRKTGAKISI